MKEHSEEEEHGDRLQWFPSSGKHVTQAILALPTQLPNIPPF